MSKYEPLWNYIKENKKDSYGRWERSSLTT